MPKYDGHLTADYAKLTYPAGAAASGTVLVKSGSGLLFGIMVTAATNNPLMTVYDNTTASGTTILAQFTPSAGTLYRFDAPVSFKTGVYVSSSGSVGATITYL